MSFEEVRAKFLKDREEKAARQRAMWQEESALKVAYDKAVAQEIIQRGILNRCKWSYSERTHTGTFCLECPIDSESELKELYQWTEADYHDEKGLIWISPEEYKAIFPGSDPRKKDGDIAVISLRFDDGDLRIVAKSDEFLIRFVTEQKLEVELTAMNRKKEKLVKELDALNQVIFQTTQILGNVVSLKLD